jgi:hypothetical protein
MPGQREVNARQADVQSPNFYAGQKLWKKGISKNNLPFRAIYFEAEARLKH